MNPCLEPRYRCRQTKVFGGLGLLVMARVALVGLVAVVSLYWPGCAQALSKSDMSFPHAMTPAFRWSESVDMHLSGIPVVVRGFVAAATLDQTAKLMARHQKHFQRVTTLPGSILLSGVYAGRHWVAQLEARHGHVKGMVSALPLSLAHASTERRGSAPTPWLTQNAGFVFEQSSNMAGRRVTHSVYQPRQPLGDFVSALAHHLNRAGWKRSGGHSWERVKSGREREEHIKVFPVPPAAGQGGAVFISRSD